MPSRLDSYSIVERVQVVAGATWYRANDDRDGSRALLIVFDARRSMTQTAQVREMHQREQEIERALVGLSDHPQIPRWAGTLTQTLGVAYEDRYGIPLTAWLDRYGQAPQIDVISFSIQMLDALAYAHDHGVLHRGLSPAMVWVNDAPTLSLRGVYGFGVASLLDIEKAWAGTATVHADVRYMAPEQFTAEPLQAATDLYAVGLLAHRLLSSRPAADGDSVYDIVRAHCDGEIHEIPVSVNISEGLRACISKALRREASTRYVNARQMMHALRGEMRRATRSMPQIQATQQQYILDSAAGQHPEPLSSKREGSERSAVDGNESLRASRPGYARAVDLQELPSASDLHASPSTGEHVMGRTRRRSVGFPWRTLVGVWLVALVIGAIALWSIKKRASSDDVDANGDAAGAMADAPAECRWEHVVRSVRHGKTELGLSGEGEVVLEYDRMNARIMRREETGLRPIRYIRAFGSLQMWHRHLPESGRDWIFLLPRVRNAQRPTLRALQFDGDTLLTSNNIPLSLETAERAHVRLRVHNNECLVWVRVEGDQGPGPSTKEVLLRLVDPGIVVESGALGGLWAPSFDDSPL